MLPFKVNYSYKLRISLIHRQAKKTYLKARERIKKLIEIYKGLYKLAKLVQERIKAYYNQRRSKGPDLKEGDKVQLYYKNLAS